MTPTDWAAVAGLLVLLPALCGVMSWLSMRYYNRHTRIANQRWTDEINAREKAMSEHADVLQKWESALMHRELELSKRAHDTRVLIDATLNEITEINWTIPD